MNGAGGQKSAQVDLDPLLRGKHLPDEVRKRAEALVKRLTTPVCARCAPKAQGAHAGPAPPVRRRFEVGTSVRVDG